MKDCTKVCIVKRVIETIVIKAIFPIGLLKILELKFFKKCTLTNVLDFPIMLN